jgi:H+/Cl- antiporter ClcA
VILAGMTAIALHGNYHYFGSVEVSLPIGQLLLPVLVCGLLGGLLGGLFSHFLVLGTRHLAPLRRAHPYLFAASCGLLLAAVGLGTAGLTFGTGYDEARRVLSGGEGNSWYPLAKLAATLVSYWSGIPGGIFAPTLSTGAGLGAALGELLTSTPIPALALLSMTAYFTGVVRSPITAVVVVVEMTNDHAMLLPLMGTALVAEWVSRHVCAEPLYKALAHAYLHNTGATTGKDPRPPQTP